MLSHLWKDDVREQYVRAFDRQETFLPFRRRDLCLLLVEEFLIDTGGRYPEEDVFALVEFSRRLSHAVKLTTARRFDEWKDSYVMLDPDVDVLLHESYTRKSGTSVNNAQFLSILKQALEDGSFEKLTEPDFNEALNARSVLGLDVALPGNTEIQTIIFARGRRMTTVEIPDWRTLHLTSRLHRLKTYQRVVLLLQRKPQEKTRWPLFSRLASNFESSLSKSIQPGKLYFKIFKDIEASDIDMLIPGSRVQFTRLDFFFLVIPLLLALISAAWKVMNGTMNFNTMGHAVTSIGLVILPLVYAARAYIGFRHKRTAYQANLIKKLSLQTIANNSGALTAILDEVANQETMDALLAYVFLWKGRHAPQDSPRSQMTSEVEAFLNRQLMGHHIETQIRFNGREACEKLLQMGLFQRYCPTPSDTWLQVVNLNTAMKRLSTIDLIQQDISNARGNDYEELSIDMPPRASIDSLYW